MSTTFLTDAPLAVLGGFLVVVSQAFNSRVLGWVAFGVAIGAIVIVLLAQLSRERHALQRTVDAAAFTSGGLLIAFSIVASGSAVIWLTFAFGLGITALAFTGLTLHEVHNWRTLNRLPDIRWLHENESGAPVARAA